MKDNSEISLEKAKVVAGRHRDGLIIAELDAGTLELYFK